MRISRAWTDRVSLKLEKKVRLALLKTRSTKGIARKAGYVQLNNEIIRALSSSFVVQIDYFNQRRVIAEAQKDRLARAAAQAEEAKNRGL